MTARLTRSRDAAYRSHVGADNATMSLGEGLSGYGRPNRAASHSERGFALVGRVDYSQKG